MHIDARDYDQDSATADICIVGAGAAGLTLATQLVGSGRRTIVLESGGFERAPQTDELNAAQSPSIGGDYLGGSRTRVFGGTTSHWTGFCLPLDTPTFARRSWVPQSGWPIDQETLHPFYRRACEQIGVDPWERDGSLPRVAEATTLELSPGADGKDRFKTRVYQIERNVRFGPRYRERLTEVEDVVVFTNATCTGLMAAGSRIDRVVAQTLNQKRIEVKAKVFVLAAGGIENPRLMLVSNAEHEKGLGNGHDLVGRYYMDHPELVVGEAMLWPGWELDLYTAGQLDDEQRGIGGLFATVDHQRDRGLLQAGIQLIAPSRRWGKPAERPADQAICAAGFWLDCARGATRDNACLPTTYATTLFARSEQAPDADNRVRLSERTDGFGNRQPVLDWAMKAIDRDSLRRTVEALGRSLYRSGVGRFRPFLREGTLERAEAAYGPSVGAFARGRIHKERQPTILLWGHHMGTTRMSDSPTGGVVDRDCRVHGIGNLFIAGSSVFPTGGAANPTLTIVALAHRLADRLKRELLGARVER